MTNPIRRLAALFASSPLTAREQEDVVAFLRVLGAGGTLLDSDPRVESRAARNAERLGYTSSGGGWSMGVTLTPKGKQALRPMSSSAA